MNVFRHLITADAALHRIAGKSLHGPIQQADNRLTRLLGRTCSDGFVLLTDTVLYDTGVMLGTHFYPWD